MKKIIYSVAIVLMLSLSTVFAQNVDGRFVMLKNEGNTVSMMLQLRLQNADARLADATIAVKYDTAKLSFPERPVKDSDYGFYTFQPADSMANLVRMMNDGVISVNISNIDGQGTDLNSEYKDVVVLNFKKNTQDLQGAVDWAQPMEYYSPESSESWAIGEFQKGYVVMTSVDGAIAGAVPAEYAVQQNYPNPFNPSTTIRYSVPFESHVTLSIYNTLGELAGRLVDKVQGSGVYEAAWDAASFASGVYIYKIEAKSVDGAHSFQQVRKMMLTK